MWILVVAYELFLEEIEVDQMGSHSHQCEACHVRWSHSDSMAGSEKAHICPNCGAGPFWVRL